MGSDRQRHLLRDLGAIVTGKTPKTAVESYFNGITPFVTPTDFDGRRWIDKTLRTLTSSGVDAVRSSLIPAQSVMVTCIGSDMGKVAMSAVASVTNQQINTLVVSPEHDARYVYYNLLGRRAELRAMAAGSAQPILNKSSFGMIEIELPTSSEQSVVADTLSTLDDHIDNLRQTNTTLEAIAQALFKSWFVDFDPVHAKAEGRAPEAMDAATAALFPSEFEESELGLIPKGWIVKPFGTQFDFTMGQSPPGSTYNPYQVGVPFFQGCTDFGDVFPAERIYCSKPTRFARAGDVLMSVRAPVGALNITTFGCSIGRGLCGVRHKSGSTGLTYLSLKACIARIENAAGEGALFRSLSKQQLTNLPVLMPNKPVTSSFIAIIEPIIDRMIIAAQQGSHLSQLRDTLLPRLISGKLRLPEVVEATNGAHA